VKTYSELEVFSSRELYDFKEATRLVSLMPDVDQHGRELRCHEVARVVGRELGLPWYDGKYEYGCEHSWLGALPPSRHILDVYTVGRLPPVQLVAVVTTLPTRYKVLGQRTDIREDVVRYLRNYLRVRNN
jgi:hypothetical protein